MANGFLATSPTTRSGTETNQFNMYGSVNMTLAIKFTCPGSGQKLISEIGFWGYGEPGNPYPEVKMAIFTHDAVNNCPESAVENSSTGIITCVGVDPVNLDKYKVLYADEAQPQLEGGTDYWIAWIFGNKGFLPVDYLSGSITGVYKTAPNFNIPTGSSWHSHSHTSTSYNFYAVYYTRTVITVPDLSSESSISASGLFIDKIVCPELSSVGILDALAADWNTYLTVDPLASQGVINAGIGIFIPAELIGRSVLSGAILIGIPAELISQGLINIADVFCIHDPEAQITYECILSNDDDNIVLPIESFQGYFRTNESSYLGVVVPTIDYEGQVNDAIAAGSCTLAVYMIKTYRTGNIVRELVQTVDIDETGVRIDEGATNQSMTLSGYGQEVRTPKVSVLGSSFKKNTQYSADGIKYGYQCQPDLFLRAGDTVRIDGKEFTADSIRWEVNVERGQMTVLPV